ncbi:MAG TPA: phosphate propanoyltransferase [Candidatus Flavonifractor merdipullorum]|uniref:Phosphate propanoyltransferase n=1 Tax=Candidatus Flavonifractor merdipullorum TaxID=2838590 RepID=A0A9D1UP04_9FIRM|nr:phosphate propanoyltransferase [Candidatus Flavonifractor merdipullorum]
MQTNLIETLTNQLSLSLGVELEASGRHVHLSKEDVTALFGPHAALTPVRPLSQPGQFVCAQRVTLEGPKGTISNVVVLGPERPHTQVELSLTDGVALGIRPPVRLSGDVAGTPGITLRYGDRSVKLSHGVIAAKRHIHLTPADARRLGVENGEEVRLACLTSRPLTFGGVEVRVSPDYRSFAHLDYDEANACGFQKGDRAILLPG